MFTGLIELVGKVKAVVAKAGGMELVVDIGQSVKSGESIAVNGVCLTVVSSSENTAKFDVSPETLAKTTLGKLKTGSQVNIERALRAEDRFGGHFVQGHIDAIGKIKGIENKGNFWKYIFEVDKKILNYVIPKGSIAIDGVSLTIADIRDNNFAVAIIPTTYEKTIFRNYKIGDLVNVETDIICRVVKRQLENILGGKQSFTIDKLKEMGF
jgi:riboflavin synthase